MILFVGLVAAAHAATYRVCFSANASSEVRCGDSIPKKTADAFVAQATRDFPNLNYYVDVQSKPVDWNRARWAGAAAVLGAGIFDAHTTTQVIMAGGFEQNPIYGSHPSAARLYGTNIGTVVFFLELAATAVHVGAGVHNEAALDRQRTQQQK
jgi:hypothetical protein